MNQRLWGADRYATSVAVSKKLNAVKSGRVIIATGQDFPDALTAGPAAALIGAPVLLTQRNSIPTNVKAELKRLAPSQVLIVGGTGAISTNVEKQIRSTIPKVQVFRAGGTDRYDTAVKVSKLFWPTNTSNTVFVTTGRNFPDALAGAGAAAKYDSPILLVNDTKVPGNVTAELKRLKPANVYHLGLGANNSTLAALKNASGGTAIEIGGQDRYLTATAIANRFFGGYTKAILASGVSFPDALVGTPISKATNLPVILVESSPCTVNNTRLKIYNTTKTRIIIGGTGIINNNTLIANKTGCYTVPSGNRTLDGYLAALKKRNPNLWSAFYDQVVNYHYIEQGHAHPRGNFTIPFAIQQYQSRGGNCYHFASLFMWQARSLGYSQARVKLGYVPLRSGGWSAHGWVEIPINGRTYVFDPEGAYELSRSNPGRFYYKTYGNMPLRYYDAAKRPL